VQYQAALGASFDLIDRFSEEILAEQLSVSEFNIYAETQVSTVRHPVQHLCHRGAADRQRNSGTANRVFELLLGQARD
jgi:hypothetical protein